MTVLGTWSVDLDAPTSGAGPTGAARIVTLQQLGGAMRVVVDGRVATHTEADGALSFSLRGRSCRIAQRGPQRAAVGVGYRGAGADLGADDGWELTIDGAIVAARPPPAAGDGPTTRAIELKWVVFLAIVGLFAGAWLTKGKLWARPPTWAPSWRTVSGADGRLSVALPAAPRLQTERVTAPSGAFDVHVLEAEIPRAASFGVGWIAQPFSLPKNVPFRQAEELCAGAIGDFLKAVLPKSGAVVIVKERAVEAGPRVHCRIAGHLERRWGFADILRQNELMVRDVQFVARVWIIDGHVYGVTAAVGPTHHDHPDLAMFLGSVRIDGVAP